MVRFSCMIQNEVHNSISFSCYYSYPHAAHTLYTSRFMCTQHTPQILCTCIYSTHMYMHTHSNTMCTCQTQCAHATHVHTYTLKHTTSHSPYTHYRTHAHMPIHLQISYGSSSPTLSDRDMFPTFFRTIPSETQSNSARFALMERYNWSKVATLHETRNVFTLVS